MLWRLLWYFSVHSWEGLSFVCCIISRDWLSLKERRSNRIQFYSLISDWFKNLCFSSWLELSIANTRFNYLSMVHLWLDSIRIVFHLHCALFVIKVTLYMWLLWCFRLPIFTYKRAHATCRSLWNNTFFHNHIWKFF